MNRVRKQLGVTDQISIEIDESIGVGILDSGVYFHPDLRESVVAVENIIGKQEGSGDYFGHGTHVAGIIAGDGRCFRGKFKGIAPKTKLYVAKILDRKGQGELEQLIQGMEWLYENRKKFSLRIVNISIGIVNVLDLQEQKPHIRSKLQKLESLCRQFYKENILIVVAAGNRGPEYRSISLLGDSDYVLSVGCHDGQFRFPNKKMCAEYSGRGPGRENRKKPDIVAPGTSIVSCANYGRGYVAKSGTSMATPIVTGAAVLAFSKFPDWDVSECMQKLLYTATDLGEKWEKQGHGMVNIKGLLTLTE